MDIFLRKSYFVFLLVLPLVFYPGTYDQVLLPRQVFLCFFLVLVLSAYLLSDEKTGISRNAAYAAFAIFFACNLISSLHSQVIPESLQSLIRYAALFIFFWITAEFLLCGRLTEKVIYNGVMAFGIIAILMGIAQIAIKATDNVHVFRAIQEIYGGFGNKNLLASILFMCFPFFFGGSSFSKVHKIVSIAGILMALVLLIIIRTRAVFIASAVYAFICFIFYLKITYKIRPRYILWSAFALAAVLIFSSQSVFRKVVPGLMSSQDIKRQYFYRLLNSKTLESRIDIWHSSWRMFLEHPFSGVGPGNWQIYFPKYGLSNFTWVGIENGTASIQRPHNDFLWVLCENGIPGLLSYISIFAIIIYQLLALTKEAGHSQKWRFIHLLSAVTGYIVIAFFDFPLERNEHQILLMLIFALTAYHYCKLQKTQVWRSGKSFIGAASALIFICFMASMFRLSASVHSESARLASKKSDWGMMAFEARKSKSCMYKIDALTIPAEWYEGAAMFQNNSADFGLSHFEKALKETPYNIRVIHDLASAYEKNKNHQQAIRYYRRAILISPKFEEARINLAAAYFNSGQFDLAFTTIDNVDIHTSIVSYRVFLAPIIEKKINSILKDASPEIVRHWQQRLKTGNDLLELYFASKKNNTTFTNYILKTNLI